MPSISVRGLHKSFPRRDGSPLQVLHDFSFEVDDAEFVCLLGPSGCGKSTTLDILSGLTTRDHGEVLVDGESGKHDAVFGYVFQSPRLLNWRTVRANLEFALSARQLPKKQWNGRIDQYLSLVGLADFADVFPLALSGGMQQRTAIARALVIEPDVLLMDEPFSSLDELTARRLRRELTDIWQASRRTIVFVTHNALEAAFLADRVYVTSPRPASLIGSLEVEVPRPRRPDDPRLIDVQHDIIRLLERGGVQVDDARVLDDREVPDEGEAPGEMVQAGTTQQRGER
jgi:NitT/TauT family transport system ATP-binding protein